MKLFFGGVRGAYPVTAKDFQEFGGDTTSFLIMGDGGEAIICDAGTGIRGVYEQLSAWAPELRTVLCCFSHFHLDHLAGFPAFRSLYDEAWTVEIAARVIGELTVEDVVTAMVQPPLWPLTLDELAAGKRFRIFDEESEQVTNDYGGLTLRWCRLPHPGGSTAFRIDEPATGTSVVIATDVEWEQGEGHEQQALRDLCATPTPATLLVFDGQYDQADYDAFRGWGHSTWQNGVELARTCGVDQLLLTHHDPLMNDTAARAREQAVQAAWPQAALARQGQVWTRGCR